MIRRSGHYFTVQEWIEIKTCAKCGKANDVMRKYCTRCGASLLKKDEVSIPEPVEEPEEESVAETPIFSEERHVLPSEVASEQVEMESDEPDTYKEIETTPSTDEMTFESEEEEEAEISESSEMDPDRGRAVVKDILEKVRAAEARSKGEEIVAPPETEVEPPPEETFEEMDEPIAFEEPEVEAAVEESYVDEPEPAPPEVMPLEEPVPVSPSPVFTTVHEPARDEKIRVLESDIKTFNIEREQLHAELEKLRNRLDDEVERYLVVAETKRTRAESLERELSLAKNEYNDANKEHKNAENRRKKELSNAEKRIRDVESRIKKAEDSRDKRIRDLEKERLKREEEARK